MIMQRVSPAEEHLICKAIKLLWAAWQAELQMTAVKRSSSSLVFQDEILYFTNYAFEMCRMRLSNILTLWALQQDTFFVFTCCDDL